MQKVCHGSYFHLRNIRRILKYLTNVATKSLIHTFDVSSRLNYCNSLLLGLPEKLITKLQRVLNMAARLVRKSRRYDHIKPVLKSLHWLPVHQRVLFKTCTILFRILNDMSPNYLKNLIEPYRPIRKLRSGSKVSSHQFYQH